MLLAGDVGGTNTRLGLYSPGPRPAPAHTREYPTLNFESLETLVKHFLNESRVSIGDVRAAAFGVAGPVIRQTAQLTNVPWTVNAITIKQSFGFPAVELLNDLEAMAYGVTVLEASELRVLQEGTANDEGNVALLAAGTGLGEALLHRVNGRLIPSPSEAGHSDFPARNEDEIRLVRDLFARLGRAELEQVVSGTGIVNIHRVSHEMPCVALDDRSRDDAPAIISNAGMKRLCSGCVKALEMFVDAYGAEAGNTALRVVATGGVFLGGGIAPKILPALSDGRFLNAFSAKAPFEDMLRRMPVKVILNEQVGLLGAAVYASMLQHEVR
jgi:glucokinase